MSCAAAIWAPGWGGSSLCSSPDPKTPGPQLACWPPTSHRASPGPATSPPRLAWSMQGAGGGGKAEGRGLARRPPGGYSGRHPLRPEAVPPAQPLLTLRGQGCPEDVRARRPRAGQWVTPVCGPVRSASCSTGGMCLIAVLLAGWLQGGKCVGWRMYEQLQLGLRPGANSSNAPTSPMDVWLLADYKLHKHLVEIGRTLPPLNPLAATPDGLLVPLSDRRTGGLLMASDPWRIGMAAVQLASYQKSGRAGGRAGMAGDAAAGGGAPGGSHRGAARRGGQVAGGWAGGRAGGRAGVAGDAAAGGGAPGGSHHGAGPP